MRCQARAVISAGPHPERNAGWRCGCGHQRGDDADPIRLPHCRVHLWHRVHSGVCLPHGECCSGGLQPWSCQGDRERIHVPLSDPAFRCPLGRCTSYSINCLKTLRKAQSPNRSVWRINSYFTLSFTHIFVYEPSTLEWDT